MQRDFSQCCAEVATLAPECKMQCRNGDMIVCIEACAKMCHTCANMECSQQLDPRMLGSLHRVCTWCLRVWDQLQVGRRESCLRFMECCRSLCRYCEQHGGAAAAQPMRSGGGQDEIMPGLELLRHCCQHLLTAGIQQKPAALVQQKLSHQQLAQVECCLHAVRCLQFMCGNAPENVDCVMVECCAELCAKCVACGFCVEEAQRCHDACRRCCQQQQHPELIRSSSHGSPQEALLRLIQSWSGGASGGGSSRWKKHRRRCR